MLCQIRSERHCVSSGLFEIWSVLHLVDLSNRCVSSESTSTTGTSPNPSSPSSSPNPTSSPSTGQPTSGARYFSFSISPPYYFSTASPPSSQSPTGSTVSQSSPSTGQPTSGARYFSFSISAQHIILAPPHPLQARVRLEAQSIKARIPALQ